MGVELEPLWYTWANDQEFDKDDPRYVAPTPNSIKKKKKKNRNKKKHKRKNKQLKQQQLKEEQERIVVLLNDPSELYSDEDDGINFDTEDVLVTTTVDDDDKFQSQLKETTYRDVTKMVHMLDPKYNKTDEQESQPTTTTPNELEKLLELDADREQLAEAELDMYASRDIKKGEILFLDANTVPRNPEWYSDILKLYKSKKNNL
jgi:hypothetical protein